MSNIGPGANDPAAGRGPVFGSTGPPESGSGTRPGGGPGGHPGGGRGPGQAPAPGPGRGLRERPGGEPGRPARPEAAGRAGRPIPVREAMGAPAAPLQPPKPAPEDLPTEVPERRFEFEGEEWIARVEGESVVGSPGSGRAYLIAIRFYRAGSETAAREILFPRGRFEALYDEELRDLLRSATPLKPRPGRT